MKTHPRDASTSALPQDVLRRLTGTAALSPLHALQHVTTEPTEVEDFRPLSECLEWRLADIYWDGSGVIPFVRNDVPYLVNNTGRLSENAAALVFAAFNELRSSLPERLTILELGAGTGLHARYFLDAFSALCRDAGSDLYDRLTYVVTDRFERTVAGWEQQGLFAEHEGHVALRVCDATAPSELSSPGGEAMPPLGTPLVVFCNYLLDVLPSRIVRRAADGLEQLCVRTHLVGGATALKLAGIASLDEARALAASGVSADLTRLLPLLPQLDFETAFRPWTPGAGVEEALASAISGDDRAIVNGRALDCVDKLLDFLHESGFVLVNDYGPVRYEDVASHVGVQRFGGSVALGLNFPLFEKVLVARGLTVVAPEGDEQRRVHTRLIARRAGEQTAEVLRCRFRLEAERYLDAPLEEARRNVAAGRTNDALAAYRVVIERSPRDWQMLGEAAEYVGLQLRDYAAGLEIARAALERNPWCSAWLWNVLGDCLFCREKYDEAHDAFMQAQRIDAEDPRTNLNLAYTFSVRGAMDDALAAIARGLAQDGRGRGAYRARLLEKQGHVLATLSERASADQERLVKRADRFR
jgi:tetratricopeptide (TPR) repeat protein